MGASRYIEISFCLLAAFLGLAFISFLTLRPALKQARTEAQNEWSSFQERVEERNGVLPGLAEAFKSVEPGHGKLVEKLLEARSISMRTTDPATMAASADDIDRCLVQIEQLAQSQPDLNNYPPFATHWDKTVRMSRRIANTRRAYNYSAQLYNQLLTPFPQSLLTVILGFVPLTEYPSGNTVGEADW